MDALQTYRQIYYPESRFGGFTHVDATINFYSRVHELLTPSSIILDVGCGRGWYAEDPVAQSMKIPKRFRKALDNDKIFKDLVDQFIEPPKS